jgi:hypothetical protein
VRPDDLVWVDEVTSPRRALGRLFWLLFVVGAVLGVLLVVVARLL